MAHGVGARGHHLDQSIRRRACVRSGGSGRFTPTAVRLAPPDRTGADLLDSGGPPMGSPHGPRIHAVCPGLGSTRGRLDRGHKAAHDARRTLHGSEGVACVFPLLPYSLIIKTSKCPPFPPSSSFSCWLGPTVSGLDMRTSVLLPHRKTAAARRPGDRSPWFAASGTCFLAVLFPGPLSKFLPQFPLGVNHSCSPTPSSLSHVPLNEQHQSITGHPHVAFTS